MGRRRFGSNVNFGNPFNSSRLKKKSSKQKKQKKPDSPKPWMPYTSKMDIDWIANLVNHPIPTSHDLEDDEEIPHDDLDDEVLLGSLRGDVVGIQYYKGNVNNKEMVALCREPYNRYDRNAIRVDNVAGQQVGHIKKEQAKPLSHILDNGLGRIEGIVPYGANNMYRISIDLTVWGKPEKKTQVLQVLHSHHLPVKELPGVCSSSSSQGAPSELDYSHVVTTRVLLSPADVKNELDKLFETLPEGDKTTMADKATAVITSMYPHQKQALNWMISRENGNALPPFWEERSNGTYFNSLTVFTSNKRPSSVLGGILADDMGLGKTLEMIALILTNFVENKPLAVPVPGRCRQSTESKQRKTKNKRKKTTVENNNNTSLNGIKKTESISLETKMAALEYSLAADVPEKNNEHCGKTMINLPKIILPQPSTSALITDTKNLPTLKMEKSSKFVCSLGELNKNEDVISLSDSSSSSVEEDQQNDDDAEIGEKIMISEKDPDYNPKLSETSSSSSVARPRRASKKPARYNLSESDGARSDEEVKNPRKKVRTCGPSTLSVQTGKVVGQRKGIVKDKNKGKAPATVKIPTKAVHIIEDEDDEPDFLPDIGGSQVTSQSLARKRTHSGDDSSDDDIPDLEECNEASTNNCDTMSGRSKCSGPRGTLIICPLSVMNNWVTQLNEHVHPNVHLEIYCYYGTNRIRNREVLSQKDIVLTTYSTVASDFKAKAPLRAVQWLRIVLDEGHMIRNPNAIQTKAIMELKTQRKWVLTGTPIQNSLKDLWSLVNFLNISPLTDRQWWHRTIERPVSHGNKPAIKRVQHLMGNIAMRRTKTQMVNGKPLISLPDKTIAIEHITLSKEERDIYTNMQDQGKIIISRYFQQGTLLHHYGQVLAILMRLRQLCCHPLLIAKAAAAAQDVTNDVEDVPDGGLDEQRKKALVTSLLEVLNSGSDEECSICLESIKFPVITSCAHVYCRPCIQAVINNEKPNPKCPLCRGAVTEDDLLDVPPEGQDDNDEEAVVTTSSWQSSAKVDALMKSLVKLREEDAGIKSIVVSQFTSLLTLLEVPLKLNGFSFVRLDGRMSAPARVEAIEEFMDMSPNTPTIFLLSLKAGGVGINLTAASRVFLMDPAWNPASEEQCFDRCHRLGQTRNVIITKFLVEDSVEERMMELQEKKRQLMQGAFNKKQTTEQRRAQRITDIKTLINL